MQWYHKINEYTFFIILDENENTYHCAMAISLKIDLIYS